MYVDNKQHYPDGDFLDNDALSPTPPWTNIRELQYRASLIESN